MNYSTLRAASESSFSTILPATFESLMGWTKTADLKAAAEHYCQTTGHYPEWKKREFRTLYGLPAVREHLFNEAARLGLVDTIEISEYIRQSEARQAVALRPLEIPRQSVALRPLEIPRLPENDPVIEPLSTKETIARYGIAVGLIMIGVSIAGAIVRCSGVGR
jgi:hypothetical protein